MLLARGIFFVKIGGSFRAVGKAARKERLRYVASICSFRDTIAVSIGAVGVGDFGDVGVGLLVRVGP